MAENSRTRKTNPENRRGPDQPASGRSAERRAAERRARTTEVEAELLEEEYRAMFELSAAGQVQMDPQSGQFVRVNRRFCELTGYSGEELLALTSADVTHPDDQAAEAAEFERLLSGEQDEYTLRKRYLRKDGSTFWAAVTAAMLRDGQGQPLRVLKVVQDVTELVEADRTLRDRTRELARSNAELEQFASVVSHDLRSPLLSINGCVELLVDQAGDRLDTDDMELLNLVRNSVRHMGELIKSLLGVARLGAGGFNIQDCDAEAAFEEAVQNIAALVQESGAKVTHDRLPVVQADRKLLGQVFQNLVENAIKYRGPDAPEVHVSVQQMPEEWLFSIRDNGIGIDSKHFEKIFRIFQRLHRDESATDSNGVGLSVAKKVVERHGGRIWLESEPGKGSTFYFSLPRHS
jgi:PAS domain S-box-containing protein